MRFIAGNCSSTRNAVNKSVALVIGAGAGIGGHVARRFADGGYHACLCRRANVESLERSIQNIVGAGGLASGYVLNAVEPDTIEDMVMDIEERIGPIEVCVYNLGAQIGNVSLQNTSEKQFELGWRLGTFGLFRVAKAVLPLMAERKSGVLLVTSATASVRGNAGQHSHAAAMGGRRMLCQTLNAEFAKQGVHVAHVLVDGAVDAPDTLGKMLGPKRFQKLREEGGLMDPASIAETYWHIAHQNSSAWTFEMDLRGHTDVPWWNSRI